MKYCCQGVMKLLPKSYEISYEIVAQELCYEIIPQEL